MSMACGIEEGDTLCISIASGVVVFQILVEAREARCLEQGGRGYTIVAMRPWFLGRSLSQFFGGVYFRI